MDEAKAKRTIDYKQENQIAAVENIVNIISVDPPIAFVTRLTYSHNKVTNCRRRKNEDLSTFVSMLRGISAEHLMLSDVTDGSQIAEVLAIKFLNNANLVVVDCPCRGSREDRTEAERSSTSESSFRGGREGPG